MSERIWITWERQRRNREVAGALGVTLFEWDDIASRGPRPLRYPIGAWRTLRLLVGRRPSLVICQNPSLILAAQAVVLRGVFGYRLVVDAHNAGLTPLEGASRALSILSEWLQRAADLTIVTNEGLKVLVESNGGRGFVLPDPVPNLQGRGPQPSQDGGVFLVCSYAADEPYRAVFEAARLLPREMVVHVSGNYGKAGVDVSQLPANVHLTGYLSEHAYVRQLASSDIVVDLTNRSDCLVCGAYEAIACGVPLVLSDTQANRALFRKGVVYTRHEPEAIAAAIATAAVHLRELREEIASLRAQLAVEWEDRRRRLEEELDRLDPRPVPLPTGERP
jgi:glycosyltransferase involved in cell wall biosynthesis